MKTKKNVEVLLENGIHFNTIMGLNDKQVKLLAEKFFKSKPMGDVEQAKEDSLKSMRAFLKTYLGRVDADKASYEEALEQMKMVARHAKWPSANRITKLGAEIYRIAKNLLNVSEAQTYNTQTRVFNPTSTTNKGEVDEVVTKITTTITQYQTDQNKDAEIPIDLGTKTVAVSGTQTPGKTTLTPMKEGDVTEKFESKAQQGLFWSKCKNSTGKKKKEWCDRAGEFSAKTTKKDYESMPEKKHPEKTVKKTTKKQTDESYERFLEERIFEMIERHIEPTMTKRDFIKSIQEKKNSSENFMLENPKKNSMFAKDEGLEMKRPIAKLYSKEMKENTTEKERTTTRPDTDKGKDRKRKNPHHDPAPGVDENPKADQKEKERTTTRPDTDKGKDRKRKNPHHDPAPGVDENPKAEEQKNDFMSAITSILNNA